VWVFDTQTGKGVRLTDPGPFDVVGRTVYFAHGTTVFEQPVVGGAASVKYDVAGPELNWLEMSPDGHALAQRVQPTPNGFSYVYSTLVGPDGVPIVRDVDGLNVDWADDGSFFVVVDYHSVRAYKPDGALLWGPIESPAQMVRDVDISPDAKHVVAVFNNGYETYALNVASLTWVKVPNVRNDVSFSGDGSLGADAVPPAGYNGKDPTGCVVSDLAGNVTPLTLHGFAPLLSPDGARAVVQWTANGEELDIIRRDGTMELRLVHPLGMSFGRDLNRGGAAYSDWTEGPRWSGDGRYLVVGVMAQG
jgi:hypothetical protein